MKDYRPDSGYFKFGANLFTGYFDQVQAKLDLNKTAIDEVWSAFPAMTETMIRNALAAFLFKGDDVYKVLSNCSGGERARIALLKLMLGRFNFLLLDEPTNHLDAFSREELENTLLNYSGTMLIVSHDRYFINKLATSVLELKKDGIVRYDGDYNYYLEKRKAETVQEVQKKPAKVNDYKLKKERASNLRKLKTKVSRFESEIEDIEEKAALLEEEIASNPPYEKLMEITQKLHDVNTEKDRLYAEWEQASLNLSELELQVEE